LVPTGSISPGANDQCTTDPAVIARSEFVIERYYQLSDGGTVAAITDCFARVWRDRNRNFNEGASQWRLAGPAFGVVIRRLDAINGCERFSGSATMRGNTNQTTSYFIIGPESGRTRIYAIQTALARPELETTACR
jgi:hypothetical protein